MSILDKFKLEDKKAIVTGGARGLGKAMAKGLAEAGADIAIADTKLELAQQSAKELRQLNVDSLAIKTDVSQAREVHQMVSEVVDEWGRVDILLNDAGICRNAPAEEMSEEDWDDVIDTNLKGVFLCCREVGERMVKRKEGVIINVSSMSAIIVNYPQPQIGYNASKAGVTMLTKSLALEWSKYNIRVNEIAPGYMETAMTEPFLKENPEVVKKHWIQVTPMKRLGQPEELAAAAIYLASDASSFMTGQTLILDGGYTIR